MVELPAVKVCGLTRPEDVRCALEAGADALGFVHYPPSPRHLEAGQAARLARAVPPCVPRVAVVVDGRPSELGAYLEASGLDWVQLCGREEPGEWRGFGAPILRRLAVEEGAERELAAWEGIATGFVLDHPAVAGGGGVGVELERAARLARRVPCLLAGGLDGDNVARCVAAVGPRGVDASSRLECRPGVKDPAAVSAFTHAARAALAELHRKEQR